MIYGRTLSEHPKSARYPASVNADEPNDRNDFELYSKEAARGAQLKPRKEYHVF